MPASTVLFLCVANSARSQMAEGIARSLAPDGVQVRSAGSAPAPVNPLAVAVLAEIGIDISEQRSKGVDAIPLDDVGTLVTLCSEEVCLVLPADREVERLHWALPDPAAVGGDRGEQLAAYRQVRDELQRRIPTLWSEYEAP